MENDPGASSGSGMAYERPPEHPKDENPSDESNQKKPKLSVVSELEKSGMTEVVVGFYEHKNPETAPTSPGLSSRYHTDHSPAKGLLLNKKAE